MALGHNSFTVHCLPSAIRQTDALQNYKVESLKLLGVEMNTSVRNTLFGLASTAVTFLVSSGISYYQDIKNS